MVISRLPRIDHMARTLGAPIAVLFVWDVAVTAVYLKVPHSVRAVELPRPMPAGGRHAAPGVR